MTKAQLQRRYEYLLLQLKVINQLANTDDLSDDNMARTLGAINFCSEPTTIKDNIAFIEDYDKKYNFYHKTMNIDEYLD